MNQQHNITIIDINAPIMLMSVNRVLKNGVLMNGFKITRGKIGCSVCVYIKTNLQLCNGSCEMVIVELAS